MKSQKGVTLTSLAIYIVVVLIVLGILAVISGVFQGNIKEIYSEGTNNAEIDKFNVYFLKEVKRQGNEISTISNNEIVFTTGNKYTFNNSGKCIYLNNTIKIAENIEKCIFSTNIENERTVITVTIKAVNGEEKNIQYVLAKDIIIGSYEDESDYTSVTVPSTYKTSIEGLAEGVTFITYENLEAETSAEIKAGVDEGKISAVLKETITLNGVSTEALAVIPTGYTVSITDGEDSISQGLVIYDGTSDSSRNNEFVWVPVAGEFAETYNSDSYSEPTTVSYDTQTDLNTYYGTNHYTIDTGDTYQNNVNNTFAYKAHYAEMVESVNDYKGYYIGRYETTIDGNSIGSKVNTTVLTPDKTLEQTNNNACRWWGLYDVQRKSNVAGNGSTVQTNMIWGQQWEAMITFFGSKDYSETSVSTLATSGKQNAGVAKYTYNGKQISDEICNIFDLRGNTFDWTAEANDAYGRAGRGGCFTYRSSASNRNCPYPSSEGYHPDYSYSMLGSRLTLYIK